MNLLIEKSANANARYDNGDIPLHVAVTLDRLKMIDALIKQGAREHFLKKQLRLYLYGIASSKPRS
ncbi:hypothetical protein BIY23_04560 [Wolbachia pipientis]|uniref:Uncharacterized protein n=1 Tax=Wolbachia pipientis TaxID=955 RepID=A0A1E7QKX9_WOLPI|nr:hypothetical protein BIY23_04560 [Wolbachia pipientis]